MKLSCSGGPDLSVRGQTAKSNRVLQISPELKRRPEVRQTEDRDLLFLPLSSRGCWSRSAVVSRVLSDLLLPPLFQKGEGLFKI